MQSRQILEIINFSLENNEWFFLVLQDKRCFYLCFRNSSYLFMVRVLTT